MAIFNSYVKLPEGMIFWGSNLDHFLDPQKAGDFLRFHQPMSGVYNFEPRPYPSKDQKVNPDLISQFRYFFGACSFTVWELNHIKIIGLHHLLHTMSKVTFPNLGVRVSLKKTGVASD